MRLINVYTNRLESFTNKIPRYAILSHTWYQDNNDEVTFQEMLIEPENRPSGTTSKPGYEKILKTCEITKHFNEQNGSDDEAGNNVIRYVWIDTCCIDKSSSAELSEAINSMYRYYQEAVICFAYLSDMGEDPLSFEKSRWFTRGWTLQELIAPAELHFYDENWSYRADREFLSTKIRAITNISTFTDIHELPVAVRMSWASNRETTRPEDLAYCLMGILDVNMPLLYGEGKKAFIRLQEQLIDRNPDLSIFAWKHPSQESMFSGLLAESPKWFQDGHNLEHVPSMHTVYCTFSVSNQGIQIKSRLKYHDETGCLLLPLGHQYKSREYKSREVRLGISLRRIDDQFYVRAFPSVLPDPRTCSSFADWAGKESVIARSLSHREASNMLQNSVLFPRRSDVLVKGVAPQGCFDPSSRRLYAGHKGLFKGFVIVYIEPILLGIYFQFRDRLGTSQKWTWRGKEIKASNRSDFHDLARSHLDKQKSIFGDTIDLHYELVTECPSVGPKSLAVRLLPLDYDTGTDSEDQPKILRPYEGRRVEMEFLWKLTKRI